MGCKLEQIQEDFFGLYENVCSALKFKKRYGQEQIVTFISTYLDFLSESVLNPPISSMYLSSMPRTKDLNNNIRKNRNDITGAVSPSGDNGKENFNVEDIGLKKLPINLFINAPVGSGKSLCLLLLAIFAKKYGKKTIISTATNLLIDQYIKKDIPSVLSALTAISYPVNRTNFRYNVLKGKNNYICKKRIKILTDTIDNHGSLFLPQPNAIVGGIMITKSYLTNLQKNIEGQHGDVTINEDEPLRPFIQVDKLCQPKSCDFIKECSYFQTKLSADLIITNHYISIADAITTQN